MTAAELEPCASCGHVAADHALTEAYPFGGQIQAHECDVPDCICERFTSERDDE